MAEDKSGQEANPNSAPRDPTIHETRGQSPSPPPPPPPRDPTNEVHGGIAYDEGARRRKDGR